MDGCCCPNDMIVHFIAIYKVRNSLMPCFLIPGGVIHVITPMILRVFYMSYDIPVHLFMDMIDCFASALFRMKLKRIAFKAIKINGNFYFRSYLDAGFSSTHAYIAF